MIHDVVMVIFGIGGVGGNDDGPDRHHRKIGDSPFRPVLGRDQNPVAGLDAAFNQNARKSPYLIGDASPADAAPFAVNLADKQVPVTTGIHIRKEGSGEVGCLDVMFSGRPLVLCHALPILAPAASARSLSCKNLNGIPRRCNGEWHQRARGRTIQEKSAPCWRPEVLPWRD